MQPTQSWSELRQRLSPGKPVVVTDVNGAEAHGHVSAVSPSGLTLNVAGALRQFDAGLVRQVRRDGDPLWNGLLIGAAVGAVGAILPDNKCGGRPLVCNDRQIPERITFFGIATGAGFAVDALHRDRTVLFRSPATVTLTRHGVSVALRLSP
jgi:hypothetical protein